MIKNYFRIALRNMGRQKIYTLITISGLVLGLSVFIMFALVTDFTSNFDTFHENADRIYAVVQVRSGSQGEEQHSAITPVPLAPSLKSEFPEISKAVRYFPPGRILVKHQEKAFYEAGVRFIDSDFLSIFSFKMIKGDKKTALSKGNSIVLTEDSALKYFGDENPMGKTMTLNNKTAVVVTGITENNPIDSSIYYDFLVSMPTARSLPVRMDDWKTDNQATFLLLSQKANPLRLEEKFSSFINKYYPDTDKSPRRLYLHPLLDFFLLSEGIDCYWATGRISYITIWILAILLLIIACINFMNLSTARYTTRAREVGIRKVVGANRGQLVKQFLSESTLMAILSLPGAILLYKLLSPILAAHLGQIFSLPLVNRPNVLVLIVAITIFTGIFAGSYPAFYLSAFKPISIFKKQFSKGKKGSRFRKLLVVVQFTFSIILILITFINIKQSQHNLEVDLGYDRANIVAVTIPSEARDKLDVFKEELTQFNNITSVSASTALPIEWNTKERVLPKGTSEEEAFDMNVYGIYYGFTEMLDINIVEGRSFSPEFNDFDHFIMNETAARQLQWKDPVGKHLVIGNRKGTIIGIAEDFHFTSMFFKTISPAVLTLDPEKRNYMLIKYSDSESLPDVIEFTREKWNIIAPYLPFEYITLEDAFQDIFQGDKTTEMTGVLGILAIFLSCLGLFGLSSYSVERRIKEIGIRKVLGASVLRIVRMLIWDFLKLVAIANIIAIPIAYFIMNSIINFLYAYPIKIGAGIFIYTTGLSLLIAFMTVSSQTIKMALANPANILKYE